MIALERGQIVARVSARNRELLALIPASLLLTAGFAAIFIQQSEVLSNVSLTYGAIFLGAVLRRAPRDPLHAALRRPVPVPARRGARVLRARRDLPDRREARARAGAVVRGRAGRCSRDDRLRCATSACSSATATRSPLAGLALLLLPRVPGIGQQVNGAYLGVRIGPIAFQPAEFGKIAIVIFLAAYLRDTRQVLVQGSRRFLGVTIPPLKHFGPLLVVWGAAMFMLVFIRDLGSSLMYFGGFLALLYVATNRLSFVVVGLLLFARRRVVLRHHRRPHPGPRRHLAGPVRAAAGRARGLPDRAVACSRRPTAGCSAPASARRCCRSGRRAAAAGRRRPT